MKRVIVLLAGVLAGCSGSKSAEKPSTETMDIAAAKAREHDPMQARSFRTDDGAFEGTIEATGAVTLSDPSNEMTVLTAPMDGESPVICQLWRKPLDLAATMRALLNAVGARVQVEAVSVSSVGASRDNATLGVLAQYTIPVSGGRAAGHLKMLGWSGRAHGLVCLHDQIGFEKTFPRVTGAMLESLKFAKAEPPVRYVEVHAVRANGQLVGFERVQILEGSQGEAIYTSSNASLFNKTKSDIVSDDMVLVEIAPRDGSVDSAVMIHSESAVVSARLDLKQAEGPRYRVTGTHNGKDIDRELKFGEARGLTSTAQLAKLKSDIAEDRAGPVTIPLWDPSVSPTQPVMIALSKGTAPHTIKRALKDHEVTETLDERGFPTASTITIGDLTISTERVHVRGTP